MSKYLTILALLGGLVAFALPMSASDALASGARTADANQAEEFSSQYYYRRRYRPYRAYRPYRVYRPYRAYRPRYYY